MNVNAEPPKGLTDADFDRPPASEFNVCDWDHNDLRLRDTAPAADLHRFGGSATLFGQLMAGTGRQRAQATDLARAIEDAAKPMTTADFPRYDENPLTDRERAQYVTYDPSAAPPSAQRQSSARPRRPADTNAGTRQSSAVRASKVPTEEASAALIAGGVSLIASGAVRDWLASPDAEKALADELLKDQDHYQELGPEQAAHDARTMLDSIRNDLFSEGSGT